MPAERSRRYRSTDNHRSHCVSTDDARPDRQCQVLARRDGRDSRELDRERGRRHSSCAVAS
jgi:hypothetical protein